jgi:hypothetical protein
MMKADLEGEIVLASSILTFDHNAGVEKATARQYLQILPNKSGEALGMGTSGSSGRQRRNISDSNSAGS